MKYDSTHGQFKHDVKTEGADTLVVNGHKIKCIAASREGLHTLPWGAMVLSMSLNPRAFLSRLRRRRGHITAGAKKVIISA